jgi:hypothetical protein
MKWSKLPVLFLALLCALGVTRAKNKKPDVPAVFNTARYVYVEAIKGDEFKPGLYPDDRLAISAVQDRIRDWSRYSLTLRKEEADLVFVVRKGRAVGLQERVGISAGTPTQQGEGPVQSQGQGPGQTRNGASIGTEAEVGPADDLLRVYMISPDGKLMGPVWSREMDGGLDAPAVQLVQQLKIAVEHAYPPQPAKQP